MNTLVEAEVWTVARTDQGNAVLVRPKGSELAVPIFIGKLETQTILIGLGNIQVPRPLTHDLLLSIIKQLEVSVVRIEINDLKDGTFFSRIVIKPGRGEEISIDARPSDAISLAVRVHCQVYVAEYIVDEAGISVNLVSDIAQDQQAGEMENIGAVDERTENSDLSEYEKNERAKLLKELDDAITAEDYESAAVIRDKLKNLGSA
jgi:uncharacterized protein